MKKKIVFIAMLFLALTGSYIREINAASNEEKSIPEFTEKPSDQTVKKGETIKITAIVKGTPAPEIRFYKNDTRIYANNRATIKTDTTTGKATLTISKAVAADAGIYRVKAENIKGMASETCKIKISENK